MHVEKQGSRLQKKFRLRQTINGKRPWVYLGTYPGMSPSQAKAKATALLAGEEAPQAVLRKEKQTKVESAIRTEKQGRSFSEVSQQYIEEIKRPVWNDRGRSEQSWRNTLENYILPVLGNKEIEEIQPDDVVKVLRPLWTTKHETATRTRSRVENIIDYAVALGISDKRNPARYKNLLEFLLPAYSAKVRHHPALPFDELPDFSVDLWNKNEASYDALKLILLTQVRSADAREALWTQFDLENSFWECPISKLGGEIHKLPIPQRLADLLKQRVEVAQDERLFPGLGRNKFISSNALDKSLDVFARTDLLKNRITIHGFRSTFMDWAIENEGTDKEADRQLGHREKNQVLAAYARTDRFKRREVLLQRYEDYCLSDVA